MHSLLLAGVVALGSIPGAWANVVFDVSNVSLTSQSGDAAGKLSGTFTTNDAISNVVSYNIVASAFGSFSGFTYTPLSALVSAYSLPSQYFRLDSPGNTNELQLFFSKPGLTSTGGTLQSGGSSYEAEPSGGNRLASGFVTVVNAVPTSVPEPTTIALLGLTVAGVIGTRRRRSL